MHTAAAAAVPSTRTRRAARHPRRRRGDPARRPRARAHRRAHLARRASVHVAARGIAAILRFVSAARATSRRDSARRRTSNRIESNRNPRPPKPSDQRRNHMTLTAIAIRLDLNVQASPGTIGAEIRGVDLKQPLDEATDRRLPRATAALPRGVLPEPAPDARRARGLRPLRSVSSRPAHRSIPSVDGYPELFEIDYQRTARLRATYGDVAHPYDGLSWHTDVTFVERPPLGSILNAVVVPQAGGDTMFSDQQAAYADLSPAWHGVPRRRSPRCTTATTRSRPISPSPARAMWSGKASVYAGDPARRASRGARAPGNRRQGALRQSRAHLAPHGAGAAPRARRCSPYLYTHSTSPKYTVRYHWSAGDLGFWDNRVSQHSVVGDLGDRPRVIQRVTTSAADRARSEITRPSWSHTQ